MKILGFEIPVISDAEELLYLDIISDIMANPDIDVEAGTDLINMLISHQITDSELFGYIRSEYGSNPLGKEQIYASLDRWNRAVGPFSRNDLLYLISGKLTCGYKPSE